MAIEPGLVTAPSVDSSLLGVLLRGEAWAPCELSSVPSEGSVAPANHPPRERDELRALFEVIAHEDGPDRRPVNKYPLDVYGIRDASPNAPPVVRYNAAPTSVDADTAPKPYRVDVPFVRGAFAMVGVLSHFECNEIIAAAEAVGYSPDEPIRPNAASGPHGGSARAATFVMLADDKTLGPLYRRCQPLLPQQLAGGTLAGLNARLRLYRYGQGAVYRPHVDGAWPGSAIKDGRLEYDAYGDRWSRLTFLLYLNDGFDGGCTTFFSPTTTIGTLQARGVVPRAGTVLCFPHGDTAGSLVHEGSEVTTGTKYIIRTDVLYTRVPNATSTQNAKTGDGN